MDAASSGRVPLPRRHPRQDALWNSIVAHTNPREGLAKKCEWALPTFTRQPMSTMALGLGLCERWQSGCGSPVSQMKISTGI